MTTPLKFVYNKETGKVSVEKQNAQDLIETQKLNDEINEMIRNNR